MSSSSLPPPASLPSLSALPPLPPLPPLMLAAAGGGGGAGGAGALAAAPPPRPVELRDELRELHAMRVETSTAAARASAAADAADAARAAAEGGLRIVAERSAAPLAALSRALAHPSVWRVGAALALVVFVATLLSRGGGGGGGGGDAGAAPRTRAPPVVSAAAAAAAVLPGAGAVFYSIGDWGRENARGQDVVAAALGAWAATAAARPSHVVSVGDNLYEAGARSPGDAAFAASFSRVYTHAALADVPWLLVQGNHDYRGVTAAQVAFRGDKRWNMPALNFTQTLPFSGGGGGSGSGSGACVGLVLLDSCPFIAKYRSDADMAPNLAATAPPAAQLEWIAASLGAAAERCGAVVAVGHHPVFSGGEHGDNGELKAQLRPLLEQHGVDLYLSGHDHALMLLESGGVGYVVTGAGSEADRVTVKTPEMKFFADESGFTVHSVNASHVLTSFVRAADGVVIHADLRALRAKVPRRL